MQLLKSTNFHILLNSAVCGLKKTENGKLQFYDGCKFTMGGAGAQKFQFCPKFPQNGALAFTAAEIDTLC